MRRAKQEVPEMARAGGGSEIPPDWSLKKTGCNDSDVEALTAAVRAALAEGLDADAAWERAKETGTDIEPRALEVWRGEVFRRAANPGGEPVLPDRPPAPSATPAAVPEDLARAYEERRIASEAVEAARRDREALGGALVEAEEALRAARIREVLERGSPEARASVERSAALAREVVGARTSAEIRERSAAAALAQVEEKIDRLERRHGEERRSNLTRALKRRRAARDEQFLDRFAELLLALRLSTGVARFSLTSDELGAHFGTKWHPGSMGERIGRIEARLLAEIEAENSAATAPDAGGDAPPNGRTRRRG